MGRFAEAGPIPEKESFRACSAFQKNAELSEIIMEINDLRKLHRARLRRSNGGQKGHGLPQPNFKEHARERHTIPLYHT